MLFHCTLSVTCACLMFVLFVFTSSPTVECSTVNKPSNPPRRASAVDQYTTHDVTLIELSKTSNNKRLNDTLTGTGHEPLVTVRFTAFNKTFNLLLRQNRMMFSSSYVETYYTAEEAFRQKVDPVSEHCYYTGVVQNDERDTTVAASTCNGFTAQIVTQNETYYVEPQTSNIRGLHYVFRESDSNLPPSACGVTSSPQLFVKQLINTRVENSVNWPQDLDGTVRVVELYLVNSFAQYVSQGSNLNAVFTRTKNIANVINTLYQSQNIYVVLVGVEVWTSSERMVIDYTNSSLTLANFMQYRRTNINPLFYNDNAHLITNQIFPAGVIGLAYVSTMCSFWASGGLNSDIGAISSIVATTMAHEMGHNFGLTHDQNVPGCVCNAVGTYCIMNTFYDSRLPLYTQWSSCSTDSFRYALSHGLDYCLKNVPTSLFDTSSYCGNGIIENGEQCDCGKSPLVQGCNSTCCNPSTCQLIGSATCASGRCCDLTRCQLRCQGYECRPSNGQCDLSEYCNGTSSVCPSDIFKQDSTSCTVNGVAAYCYQGQCQSHDSQCQLLWGSNSSASNPSCYTCLNMRGDFAGNCGVNNWNDLAYVSCAASDVMCGLLLCATTPSLVNFATLVRTGARASCGGYTCNSVLLDTGTQRLSPSYVPNGAQCGTGKMCLNQRCVDVSSLNATFPPCPNGCNGNGVCNSLGQCHCNAGYDPVSNCAGPGGGGSVQSGSPIIVCGTTSTPSSLTTMFTSIRTTVLTTALPSTSSKLTSTSIPSNTQIFTKATLLTTAILSTTSKLTSTSFPSTRTNLAIIANNGNGAKSYVNLNTYGREIVGIASLGTKLYVVCAKSDTIFEFARTPPYAPSKTFRITGMIPGDVVANPVSNELFVSDLRPVAQGGSRVWRFKPSTGQSFYYNNAASWIGTLAISPASEIIGVSSDVRLNTFSSKTGLKRFKMPTTIFDPQHAVIPTSSGTAYVSYGRLRNTNSRRSNVVLLNSVKNTVVRTSTTSLGWPKHLAFDTVNNNLFVTDYCNRRVVRFNSLLTSSSVILSNSTSPYVGWPQRILLDKSTKNIYVAMAVTPIGC